MFHGDTLYARSTVTAIRESSSRPGQRIVTFDLQGTNQDGTVVAKAQRTCLMWTRQAHRAAESDA